MHLLAFLVLDTCPHAGMWGGTDQGGRVVCVCGSPPH